MATLYSTAQRIQPIPVKSLWIGPVLQKGLYHLVIASLRGNVKGRAAIYILLVDPRGAAVE